MSNAVEARRVVFELFQSLEGFHLDDYKAMGNAEQGMQSLLDFVSGAASVEGDTFVQITEDRYCLTNGQSKTAIILTKRREDSLRGDDVQLLGLDHPVVAKYLKTFRDLPPEEIGLRVKSPEDGPGVLAIWAVEMHAEGGNTSRTILTLAVNDEGKRQPLWERQPERIWNAPTLSSSAGSHETHVDFQKVFEPMLQRELEHRGVKLGSGGFEANLISWIEVK